MNWKPLNKEKASQLMQSWDGKPIVDYNAEYLIIRNKICRQMMRCSELSKNKKTGKIIKYDFDLLFGLELYNLLNEYNFGARLAADDDIWRYISICVIPDIVFIRWKFNEDRFWKNSRRIYLKTLWWYIHLSWQGDIKKTYNILKDNSTDEIVQLVERSGRHGFRVGVSRIIMKQYSNVPDYKKSRSSNVFRKVMKLNTSWTTVIEPTLLPGGGEEYVTNLFAYFNL